MMAGLQSNVLKFADNNATIASPSNAYVALGPTISLPSRATQHRGIAFALMNATALTTNFMLSIRQQMDESNHEMVSMLTHQMCTVFKPLIQNTNQSYQLLVNQMVE